MCPAAAFVTRGAAPNDALSSVAMARPGEASFLGLLPRLKQEGHPRPCQHRSRARSPAPSSLRPSSRKRAGAESTRGCQAVPRGHVGGGRGGSRLEWREGWVRALSWTPRPPLRGSRRVPGLPASSFLHSACENPEGHPLWVEVPRSRGGRGVTAGPSLLGAPVMDEGRQGPRGAQGSSG